jgi:hypothetical protein
MPVYQYHDTANGGVVELERRVDERDKVPANLKRFSVPQKLVLVGVGESAPEPGSDHVKNIMRGYYKYECRNGSRFKSSYSPDQVRRAWSQE